MHDDRTTRMTLQVTQNGARFGTTGLDSQDV